MKNYNTPNLQTPRLLLRKFTPKDIQAIFEIYSDRDVNTFLPWFPLNSLEEAEEFYTERYAAVYEQPAGYHYAICLKNDNIPVGYVNVSVGDGHDLGYGLKKEFWHKGMVTEACRAVLELVKKDGMPYVTATHDVKNPRSGEVMKRLEMVYKYTYKEQWKPKNVAVLFRMFQLNFDREKDWVYKKYWEGSEERLIELI